MKNVFGSILLCFLVYEVSFADIPDPAELPYLNDSQCSEAVGFISASYIAQSTPPDPSTYRLYVISGHYVYDGVPQVGEVYGYHAVGYINGNGEFVSNVRCVYFRTFMNANYWCVRDTFPYPLVRSQCAIDFFDDFQTYLSENPTPDPAELYNHFFPPSHYDLTADDDGDGMPDYYDLDCPRYDEYLQYCADNGLEPEDLVDYQYFQDNEIDDWLAERQNMTDTDGDGFSDGYELIHGTEVYDGADYPLGIPDTGSSLLIVGGVDEKEPWRLEQYNDSGFSRGYVYDQGHDPFGTETLSFEDDPDWGLLDSDNDGLVNYAELANETDPYRFEFQSGFSYIYNPDGGYYTVTGYTEDGAFGDYGHAPTEEEWLESHADYEIGDYAFNPSEFTFGDTKYDGLLDKTGKIKFDCDNVRPQAQRDYKLTFNLPIPGAGMEGFTISVMPDQSTPAGAAMEIVRQLVRGISGVIFSYVFVKHVWLTIRQY